MGSSLQVPSGPQLSPGPGTGSWAHPACPSLGQTPAGKWGSWGPYPQFLKVFPSPGLPEICGLVHRGLPCASAHFATHVYFLTTTFLCLGIPQHSTGLSNPVLRACQSWLPSAEDPAAHRPGG